MTEYQIIESGHDGWLDRQLRKVEDDVAKWPKWMREREYINQKNRENVVYMDDYKNDKRNP